MKKELLKKIIESAEKNNKRCMIITNIIESCGGYSSRSFNIDVANYSDREIQIVVEYDFLDDNILYIKQNNYKINQYGDKCRGRSDSHFVADCFYDAEYYINLDDIKCAITYRG